ncbi:GNAT family N-acetyltransferase [Nocardioides sp. SLBN-35]|uniref:GNAT family N-acetyltransferase n=1 Tax=Nocardioides sp. SLBN-35 TaxID=2768445 RepID=UPI00114E1641|nr:GNAT family N-acetyltransferase [Nocardioides sp. SLBN-35]TQK68550.1 ribosomal protein S18 acetylase RimI-like enzyme [Nocardioides sp. SLBN-35]
MTRRPQPVLRSATPQDAEQVLSLWDLISAGEASGIGGWRDHAAAWLRSASNDPARARVVVVDAGGVVVATATGNLEVGVPDPHCPTGRSVRLVNVVTRPEHRGEGHASRLVDDVVAWARSVGADRVDLSATVAALGVYQRAGFVRTSAPRLKLVL